MYSQQVSFGDEQLFLILKRFLIFIFFYQAVLAQPSGQLRAEAPSLGFGVLCSDLRTCPMNREYYLYLPAKIDPSRTYWLVCYVHGANGHTLEDVVSIKSFVERGDCIVVAPTFPKRYQLLEEQSDQQLLGIFDQLSKKYPLHSKLFIFGHSAGGQFAHRFTLRHPDIVIGCEACSSGTWATGGVYHSLTKEAKKIPMAIACGEQDYGKIGVYIASLALDTLEDNKKDEEVHDWSRIEWLGKFTEMLQQGNFFFKCQVFPGEAHRVLNEEQQKLAIETFILGTSGMLPEERAQYDMEVNRISKNIDEGKTDLAKKGIMKLESSMEMCSRENLKDQLSANHWHINQEALDESLKTYRLFVHEALLDLQKKLAAKSR